MSGTTNVPEIDPVCLPPGYAVASAAAAETRKVMRDGDFTGKSACARRRRKPAHESRNDHGASLRPKLYAGIIIRLMDVTEGPRMVSIESREASVTQCTPGTPRGFTTERTKEGDGSVRCRRDPCERLLRPWKAIYAASSLVDRRHRRALPGRRANKDLRARLSGTSLAPAEWGPEGHGLPRNPSETRQRGCRLAAPAQMGWRGLAGQGAKSGG